MIGRLHRWGVAAALLAGIGFAAPAFGQTPTGPPRPGAARAKAPSNDQELVQLDFDDVELSVVIDTIARLTGRNFIYDDRVRGRVTIVSPTQVTVDQAYAVFESVLQVKGFTTVRGPGGAIKIIPVRDAKQSSVETSTGRRPTPVSDRYVTRLIPLRYIDAEDITATLKPLVSNDASMVAYPPTNTVILTDAATNIRRLLAILESIDIETYKEELAVIRLKHADAAALASQLSEVFGAEMTAPGTVPSRTARARRAAAAAAAAAAAVAGGRGAPRIITDERTNSLIVLASRSQLQDIRDFVRTIDVVVEGGGRIQVYYLKHADAEELAQTINALVSGAPATTGAPAGAPPQALRAAVTELAGGATVTADPATNSLVIQASPEGYASLISVIQQLDIPRPQVLVEALIMEVDITDNEELGFNGIVRLVRGNTDITLASATQSFGDAGSFLSPQSALSGGFLGNFLRDTIQRDADGNAISDGTLIQGLITAAATDNRTNILSAPHILTSDNEEAEILVGNNIPIITSRVEAAEGAPTLSSSVNVERQDIGITLRVTPQITEGDSLRLKIFQELTALNEGLQVGVGEAEEVGVALLNRRIENNVVVADEETVVIGGLISEQYEDNSTKVPWLGDIPILGWAFKTTSRDLTKQNLLVFLTPHIVRTPADLEEESIRKREEFRIRTTSSFTDPEQEKQRIERVLGDDRRHWGLLGTPTNEPNAIRIVVEEHERRYPLERMREIEQMNREERERLEQLDPGAEAPRYGVLAAVFRDSQAARDLLTRLLDAGYDGTLVSGEADGGAVLFELRVGPYDDVEAAESAAASIRDAFELSPRVLVDSGTGTP